MKIILVGFLCERTRQCTYYPGLLGVPSGMECSYNLHSSKQISIVFWSVIFNNETLESIQKKRFYSFKICRLEKLNEKKSPSWSVAKLLDDCSEIRYHSQIKIYYISQQDIPIPRNSTLSSSGSFQNGGRKTCLPMSLKKLA